MKKQIALILASTVLAATICAAPKTCEKEVTIGKKSLTKTVEFYESSEYNNLGQIISYKNADDYSVTYIWNATGTLKSEKDSNKINKNYTYDKNNNVTKIDTISFAGGSLTGTAVHYSYNENSQLTRIWSASDSEDFDWSEDGLTRHSKQANGVETWATFDEEGRILTYKTSKDFSESYQYDKSGNLIKRSNSTGFWEKYKYDKSGLLVNFQTSDGINNTYQYNEQGLMVYAHLADGLNIWTEYSCFDDGKVKLSTSYCWKDE